MALSASHRQLTGPRTVFTVLIGELENTCCVIPPPQTPGNAKQTCILPRWHCKQTKERIAQVCLDKPACFLKLLTGVWYGWPSASLSFGQGGLWSMHFFPPFPFPCPWAVFMVLGLCACLISTLPTELHPLPLTGSLYIPQLSSSA